MSENQYKPWEKTGVTEAQHAWAAYLAERRRNQAIIGGIAAAYNALTDILRIAEDSDSSLPRIAQEREKP